MVHSSYNKTRLKRNLSFLKIVRFIAITYNVRNSMLLFTPSLLNFADAFVSIATTRTTPTRQSIIKNHNLQQLSLQNKVQQQNQQRHGRYHVVTTIFANANNNRNDIKVQQKQYNTDNNNDDDNDNKEEENDDDNNNIKPVVHYLILPGFGNDSSDYTKHKSLVPSLRSRLMAADKKKRRKRRRRRINNNNNNNNNKNLHDDYILSSHDNDDNNNNIHVLPIKRIDWLQIFLHGIFDKDFWHCTLSPTNPSYKWYLDAVYDEVNRIVTKTEEKEAEGKRRPVKVVLVGHSAGGWLARAAVGFGCSNNAANNDIDTKISSNNSNNHHNEQQQQKQQQQQQEQKKKRTFALDHIAGIVSLGSPHHPPPQGAMDMTRGALRITNEQFPGTHHAPDIFYVTVVGNAIKGKQEEAGYEPTSIAAFAHQSYELVCGNGDAIGDGIVPIQSAHLDDAIQVELDNVFHSITVPMQKWYGTESIVDKWLTVVTEQIEKSLLQYRHTGTSIIKNSRIEQQQQQQQLNPTLIMQTNTTSLG